MKQKIVIKVSMNGPKSRSKVLRTAVSVNGVESAALQGEDGNQIEVVGEGIDSVGLIELLRKNLGYDNFGLRAYLKKNKQCAQLQSVMPVEEKKESGDGGDGKQIVPIEPIYYPPYFYGYPYYGF